MKKSNYYMAIVILLLCGAIPINTRAQSAPTSTDDESNKRLSYILNVTAINQHLFPSQYHDYDCFIASMLMALDFFKEDITYDELTPIVRGDVTKGLSTDSDFVIHATDGRLLATGKYTNQLAVVIAKELSKNHPIVVAISNMSLLTEHWNTTTGHAVLVYGIYNGHIFYVDPYNGERYLQHIQSFINASTYPDGSFAITFDDLISIP